MELSFCPQVCPLCSCTEFKHAFQPYFIRMLLLVSSSLGVSSIVAPSCCFSGDDMQVGYRAALWLRTGIRVLHRLATQQLNPSAEAGDTVRDTP
jgi:hypothetical protein